ncbi:MAG TPA: type III-B CRISPR module RAMP protein Cmr6 [Alphaproteobacteria bacterium]|nr:type III-B CRISPR module RAMP protein Cmr6 [Alphaproteobacteria bacterium]
MKQEKQHEVLRKLVQQVGNNSTLKEGLLHYGKRQEAMMKSLARCGYLTQRFAARTQWRLAIGLATGGVLETGGLVLHRLYGFPYLPGSSLKGLALAWARLQDDDRMEKEHLKEIFGTTDAEGRAIFFDALPAHVPTLEVDIMNPHYRDYYEKNSPPADDLSPSPIFFLTVAAGTSFTFAVALKQRPEETPKATQALLANAVQCLKDGLKELGVGAKTAAGYGYFEVEP